MKRRDTGKIDWLLVVLISTVVLLLTALGGGAIYFTPRVSIPFIEEEHPTHMLNLVNVERAKAGLGLLKENRYLDAAAQDKANDLCKQNYWSHKNPQGVQPEDLEVKHGYYFSFAGENLARNYKTDDEAMIAFMKSPEHKANILNANYLDFGYGKCGKYIVQHFGRKEFE